MAYTDVPVNSTEKFIVSSPKIKNNFTGIKTLVEVNHGTFDAADEGKHKFLTLPQQTAVPATWPPATSATEMGIYCKTNGTAPALFVRSISQAIGTVTNDVDFTTSLKAATGWTQLPSGIIIKWGTGTTTAGVQGVTVVFDATKAFATCYNVQVTNTAAGGGHIYDNLCYVSAISNVNFTYFRLDATKIGTGFTFNYFAIGV